MGRRPARGRTLESRARCTWNNSDVGDGNRCLLDGIRSKTGIQHLPGGAHPGAEHGAVSGLLMVRVVRFVGKRLRRGKPAHSDDGENQKQRDGESCVSHHRIPVPLKDQDESMLLKPARRVKPIKGRGNLVFLIGFRTGLRYTLRNDFLSPEPHSRLTERLHADATPESRLRQQERP